MIRSVEEFNSKIKSVMITEEEIKEKIAQAAKEIDSWYDGTPILLVSILKGAFVFMADICRAVTVPCEIGFMCAQSYYSGTESSGIINITMDLDRDGEYTLKDAYLFDYRYVYWDAYKGA